jgi:hypothetical protein
MMFLRRLALSIGILSFCSFAFGSGATLVWSRVEKRLGLNVRPAVSILDSRLGAPQTFLATGFVATPNTNSGYVAGVDFWSLTSTVRYLSTSAPDVPGAISIGEAYNEVYEASKLSTNNGSKIKFNVANSAVGAVPYVYNSGIVGSDSPLAIGDYPYNLLVVGNVHSQNVRQLVLLQAQQYQPAGAQPATLLSDPTINPGDAFFNGRSIYAVGNDNDPSLPHGGARASVYTLSGTGPENYSASFAFSIATQNQSDPATNTLTGYQNLWGVANNSHLYLVTDRTISQGGSFNRTYTVECLNGYGSAIWSSARALGLVTEISVGTANEIYVRGIHGAGGSQFVASYDFNGSLRWVKNMACSAIAAVPAGGVIAGDSETDSTGHHHVHFSRFTQAGLRLYYQTYRAGASTDDDYLAHLHSQNRSIYFDGQNVPQSGSRFAFGARYMEPGATALQNEVLKDDPVGYWPLDDPAGTTTAHDLSGNNYSGQLSGTVAFGSSGATGARCANFSSGRILVSDPQANRFPSANSFSVEAWYRASTYNNYPMDVVGKGHDRTLGAWQLYAAVATNHPVFADDTVDLAGGAQAPGSPQSLQTWHQLVGVASGTTLRIYIDGALNNTVAYSPRSVTTNKEPLSIGDMYNLDYFYHGLMSDVAVYPHILTANRIQAHWLAGSAH